jgi:hypothetical protein
MKEKLITAAFVQPNHIVKDWGNAKVIDVFEKGIGIIKCKTDKGVFACGSAAQLTILVDEE